MIEYTEDDRGPVVKLLESLSHVQNMALQWLDMGLGTVFVDSPSSPNIVLFRYRVMNFIAGDPNSAKAREVVHEIPPMRLLMVPNTRWESVLKEEWGSSLRKQRRTRMNPDSLDLSRIIELKEALPSEYVIRPLDLALLEQSSRSLLGDILLFYNSYDDFLNRGFGFGVLRDGNLVSLARTCFPFRTRFEIQVNTLPRFQRKGLATSASAMLIESSLRSGLVPDWDAANEESIHLALKLGYSNPQSYHVFYRILM